VAVVENRVLEAVATVAVAAEFESCPSESLMATEEAPAVGREYDFVMFLHVREEALQ
jgi:hypothetical protein